MTTEREEDREYYVVVSLAGDQIVSVSDGKKSHARRREIISSLSDNYDRDAMINQTYGRPYT